MTPPAGRLATTDAPPTAPTTHDEADGILVDAPVEAPGATPVISSPLAVPSGAAGATAVAPSEAAALAAGIGGGTGVGPAARPPLAARLRRLPVTLLGALWPALLLVAVWQAWVTIGDVDTIVMPTPLSVAKLLVTDPGFFLPDLAWTLYTATVGLVLGMSLGLVLAVAAWCSALLAGLVTAPALVIRSVPIVAMIPVIASLLGYQTRSVLVVAVLISFFPTFVFAGSGLRALPPGSADLLSVLGASRWQRFRRLALPSALPHVFVALRISASVCVAGALLAEYLLGTHGLGNVFLQSALHKETEQVWAVAVIVTILSVGAFLASSRLERWAHDRWT